MLLFSSTPIWNRKIILCQPLGTLLDSAYGRTKKQLLVDTRSIKLIENMLTLLNQGN